MAHAHAWFGCLVLHHWSVSFPQLPVSPARLLDKIFISTFITRFHFCPEVYFRIWIISSYCSCTQPKRHIQKNRPKSSEFYAFGQFWLYVLRYLHKPHACSTPLHTLASLYLPFVAMNSNYSRYLKKIIYI